MWPASSHLTKSWIWPWSVMRLMGEYDRTTSSPLTLARMDTYWPTCMPMVCLGDGRSKVKMRENAPTLTCWRRRSGVNESGLSAVAIARREWR